MKGVLHVHSTFSDGEEQLERLVQLLKQEGMDFVAVSDHAEVFDELRMEQYVELCESLSDEGFLVMPGLEFALPGGHIHILGYGVTRRIRFANMEQLVDSIHQDGGLAVLAHPPSGSINIIGSIRSKLDGIEVWNERYDGAHSPRAESFQLLRRIRSVNGKASAYCGLDLHKIGQLRKPVYVDSQADRLDRESVLRSLATGAFTLRRGSMVIPSTGDLSLVQEFCIAVKQPFSRPWAG